MEREERPRPTRRLGSERIGGIRMLPDARGRCASGVRPVTSSSPVPNGMTCPVGVAKTA